MIVHKTKYGETFDILAKRYYGDEKLMHYILEANPELRDKIFFDGNFDVFIPDLPEDVKIEEVTAPWKR
ncbi:LysM domain-containing protein [Deferribacter autotrophicus]|uniref:LysM domain-containing protein n=1 Tax=Deferribacter autotrophicus TaxID=500465 RepID=A0A5A8F1I9_9BACT|nr:tail protein X [Deferribacter autotrophicus]KAA0257216.1 LysM domain-containing protein [Deferribacter autotrophicus]